MFPSPIVLTYDILVCIAWVPIRHRSKYQNTTSLLLRTNWKFKTLLIYQIFVKIGIQVNYWRYISTVFIACMVFLKSLITFTAHFEMTLGIPEIGFGGSMSIGMEVSHDIGSTQGTKTAKTETWTVHYPSDILPQTE